MLRALFAELAAHGSVLMVVDQPRNIGALPIAVARDSGLDVAYLPGLRMRRIAALYPGQAKTDARDAFIIADAARTLPDTLLPVTQDDDIVEGIRMLAGFDADLATEENRILSRIRSVLLSVHPSLERAIGKHLYWPVALTLLAEYGGPVGFAAATPAELRGREAVGPAHREQDRGIDHRCPGRADRDRAGGGEIELRTENPCAAVERSTSCPRRTRGAVRVRTEQTPRRADPHIHAGRRRSDRRHDPGGDR